MTANYIKRIEIESLWSGHRHVVWDLSPDVNILSGVNGVGKTTILRRSIEGLLPQSPSPGVRLTFDIEEADCVRYDVVHSFDRPLMHSEALTRVTDAMLLTELDWQLYQLQRRYLDYQVNVSNRILALFTSGVADAQAQAQQMAASKTEFFDIVDDLFCETGKTIVRTSNEIVFTQYGETLQPYQLSSGEKQMLVILLTVLVQDREHYTLFMDEPEISLHIEWQQQLIALVRRLNPNAQVILTTHSPALIMNGWQDAVTDVEDIVRE
ncbi:MAG: ATP-binding protein [Bacteroidaceae bacterium]|nr:ATP-binding protein [Bacteroidaceae bacterium]